jgi:hypothetical protein
MKLGDLINGDVKLSPIPKYGWHISIEEFISNVEDRNLIDYDGWGYYATKDQMTNITVIPSQIKRGEINKKYTHVVWMNR